MNLSLRTALLLAVIQPPTPSRPPNEGDLTLSEGPPPDPGETYSYWNVRTSPEQPPDIIGTSEEIREFSNRPESVATRKRAKRRISSSEAKAALKPRFIQTTTTTRAERRARGDYRTVRQIIADFEAKKE